MGQRARGPGVLESARQRQQQRTRAGRRLARSRVGVRRLQGQGPLQVRRSADMLSMELRHILEGMRWLPQREAGPLLRGSAWMRRCKMLDTEPQEADSVASPVQVQVQAERGLQADLLLLPLLSSVLLLFVLRGYPAELVVGHQQLACSRQAQVMGLDPRSFALLHPTQAELPGMTSLP